MKTCLELMLMSAVLQVVVISEAQLQLTKDLESCVLRWMNTLDFGLDMVDVQQRCFDLLQSVVIVRRKNSKLHEDSIQVKFMVQFQGFGKVLMLSVE